MLLSIFTNMYELFIGSDPNNSEYRTGIFSSVGLITLIFSVALCLLFYAGLGRWKPVFHKPMHWLATLLLLAASAFAFAFAQARGVIGSTDGYTIRFALFNALYAALYFMLCSLVFKRLSIFAKHTPIKL